ncbi:MAG: hypothetical protein E7504_08445 [Ruminococcus sp.]|nr:hypothetical protein [Ruminococcus sp.]
MKNSEKKLRNMLRNVDMDTVEQIAAHCPAAEDAVKERIFSRFLARKTDGSDAEAAAQSVTVIHRNSHHSIWAAVACLLICGGAIGGITLSRPSLTKQEKPQESTNAVAEQTSENDRVSSEKPRETEKSEHSANPIESSARETKPVQDATDVVQMQQPVQNATEVGTVEQEMISSVTENPRPDNAYTLSYKTLSENYITNDGQSIPAGSTAITVSVSGNTGFDCNMLHLSLSGNNSTHSDSNGALIMEKGRMLRQALVSGTEHANGLCIAIASPENITADGELFTFYVKNTASDFAAVSSVKQELIPEISQVEKTDHPSRSWRNTPDGPLYTTWHFLAGDADDNGIINMSDAVYILRACAKAENNELSVTEIDDHAETWKKFFPPARSAECADANGNTYITMQDAGDVLDYAVICEVGKAKEYKGYVGFEGLEITLSSSDLVFEKNPELESFNLTEAERCDSCLTPHLCVTASKDHVTKQTIERRYAPSYLPQGLTPDDEHNRVSDQNVEQIRRANLSQYIYELWYHPPGSEDRSYPLTTSYFIMIQKTLPNDGFEFDTNTQFAPISVNGHSGFIARETLAPDFIPYRVCWAQDGYLFEVFVSDIPESYLPELIRMAESVAPIE